MNRKIITTADGSSTIHLEEWNEQYHSKHGAIQEAYHVFIDKGFHHLIDKEGLNQISILEIGFGTGLNALITLLESEKFKASIHYVGVEAYPVESEELNYLNYWQKLGLPDDNLFKQLHQTPWENPSMISPNFSLIKTKKFFRDITFKEEFDLIYFDAFGARVQPELWTEPIFKIMYYALKRNGILVTYSAKGSAKRAMESSGFDTEKLDGPPGKRHMIRATKN